MVLAPADPRAENCAVAKSIVAVGTQTERTLGARPRTGCYICRFHGGELDNGHIVCARPPDPRTMGYAARGCCYWERAPGADDE